MYYNQLKDVTVAFKSHWNRLFISFFIPPMYLLCFGAPLVADFHSLRRAIGNFPTFCHETVQCFPFLHLSCPSTRYTARELILTSCIQMHSNSCTLCDFLALSVYFALSSLNAVCLHDWCFSIANTESRSMMKNIQEKKFTLFLGMKIYHMPDRWLKYLIQIKPKLFEMSGK